MGWDPGIQGRERVLTDTVAAANRAILDLSFGLAPVCCHRAYQTKRVSGDLGSWDSIITSKTLTETIRKNLAFDQPERWFCGMLFLGQSWPGAWGVNFPTYLLYQFQFPGQLCFPTVVGIEASELEFPGKLTVLPRR